MKLQQLRYVIEIVRHNNHLSAAAEALHTSQPGVSRQVQLLEAELGFQIFLRTRNRIIGLTDPGRQVVDVAHRVVTYMEALCSLKEELSKSTRGRLTIATTHTVARYLLPNVIKKFIKDYPEVKLVLRQGDPVFICRLVDTGEADIGFGPEITDTFPNLVRLPCFELSRSIIAKVGHPILSVKRLTLQHVAAYPIITYEDQYSSRRKVMNAFDKAGITPNIVLSAVDADVSKTYVELGLGIAILGDLAFDPKHDTELRRRDARHLFEPSTLYVTLRSNTYLRRFVVDFIRSVAPQLTANAIQAALKASLDRFEV